MDDRGPSNGRERRHNRRGYGVSRAAHRVPGHSSQARRDTRQGAYVVGFVVVVLVLAAFLYVGLNWATGPGRAAALANPSTPTATAVATALALVQPTAAPPSASIGDQTYTVKAGDNPASIAQQFHVKTEELIAANNIDDPQKLQIGQTLTIPAPSSGR